MERLVEVMVSDDHVIICSLGSSLPMNTEQAHRLAIDLIMACDQARAFGEVQRGEVAEPKWRAKPKTSRRKLP